MKRIFLVDVLFLTAAMAAAEEDDLMCMREGSFSASEEGLESKILGSPVPRNTPERTAVVEVEQDQEAAPPPPPMLLTRRFPLSVSREELPTLSFGDRREGAYSPLFAPRGEDKPLGGRLVWWESGGSDSSSDAGLVLFADTVGAPGGGADSFYSGSDVKDAGVAEEGRDQGKRPFRKRKYGNKNGRGMFSGESSCDEMDLGSQSSDFDGKKEKKHKRSRR